MDGGKCNQKQLPQSSLSGQQDGSRAYGISDPRDLGTASNHQEVYEAPGIPQSHTPSSDFLIRPQCWCLLRSRCDNSHLSKPRAEERDGGCDSLLEKNVKEVKKNSSPLETCEGEVQ